MRRIIASTAFITALLPTTAFAYRVPEREYWRAFTLQLINESREEFNLTPVGMDEELNDIAQAHAADTAVHFDDTDDASRRATYLIHTSSDLRTLRDRVREYGLTGFVLAAENVGFRYRAPFGPIHEAIEESIRTMHEGMMAEAPPDDGHKRTILGDFTHVGIGLELHRPSDAEMNTLLLVTDFAKFTDGRLVRIPEVGAKPGANVPRTATGAQTAARTSEPPPERRLRRTREPSRAVDVRKRRIVTDLAIPRKDESTPAGIPFPEQSIPQAGDGWPERHRVRLQQRRSERLEQLLRRVEERGRKRLEMRQVYSR